MGVCKLYFILLFVSVTRTTLAASKCPLGNCVPLAECDVARTFMETEDGRNRLEEMLCGEPSDILQVCCKDLELGATSREVPTQRITFGIMPRMCGIHFQHRITGGNATSAGEFPWMAAIMLYNIETKATAYRCGGSLITRRYVLSAAHCFIGSDLTNKHWFNVRLGEHNLVENPDCFNGRCAPRVVIREVEYIQVHPDYNKPFSYANDIALMRLNQEVSLSSSISPICLVDESGGRALADMHHLVTAGWGQTEFRTSSNVLLKVQLPIVDQSVCNNIYPFSFRINGSQLCLGGQDGKDTCLGDSGGPSFLYHRGRGVQLGLTSYGLEFCGIREAVYTFVPSYLRSFIIPNLH